MSHYPAPRTTFGYLRDTTAYLSRYPESQRSGRFEQLVVQAFASLLRLPIFAKDGDQPGVPHRVTWFGGPGPDAKAHGGAPDGLARAHDFCIIIEATRKTSTAQWSQEFPQCLRHARQMAEDLRMDAKDVYVALVTEGDLHHDTFEAVRVRNRRPDHRIVPIQADTLARVVKTSDVAITMKHIEVRVLLNQICECSVSAASPAEMKASVADRVMGWQRDVLEMERSACLGWRSYRSMVRMEREWAAVSEILTRLQKDPILKRYYGMLGQKVTPDEIDDSLLSEGLGCVVGQLPTGEKLFCPVPFEDFRSRCDRRLQAVREAYDGA